MEDLSIFAGFRSEVLAFPQWLHDTVVRFCSENEALRNEVRANIFFV